MKLEEIKIWWDSLTKDERRKAIRKDKTMRDPAWKNLIEAMTKPFDELTRLQQESLEEIWSLNHESKD